MHWGAITVLILKSWRGVVWSMIVLSGSLKKQVLTFRAGTSALTGIADPIVCEPLSQARPRSAEVLSDVLASGGELIQQGAGTDSRAAM